MRKKLILFLMLALFGSTSFLRADEVTIGDGTSTTGYFPFYTLYNYSIAENLYLASELQAAGMSAGTITSLSWYATNSTGYEQQGLTLWMANVTDTELTTTSHVTTGMTQVYTGSMTPAIGWNEFVFNQGSFEWDGTSNILIFCQRNNGEWNSTISWQATSGLSFNAMAYRYQDSGAYDVTVPQTMYTSTTRPNITFNYTTGGGGGGAVVDVTIGDPTSTTTNSYLPGYSYYEYAFSQQIYTAAEIGVGGTINTLTMWLKNTSSYGRNYNVYMKEVTESEFASTSAWVSMTASDMVASFTLNNGISDPVETAINLTTPFNYSGIGNLVICIQDITGSWSSGAAGVVMDATGYQAMYANRDGTLYDPTTPGVNGTRLTVKNVVKLNITTAGGGSSWTPNVNEPLVEVILTAPLYNEQNVASPVTLEWENDDNAFEYKVECGTVYGNLETVVDWDTITGKTGTAEVNLYPNTRYFWRVYNRNNVDEISSDLGVFTSEFNTPTNVKVIPDKIFTDGSTLVKWNIVGGAIGELPETTIGSGTSTSSYLPTYNLYNYSLTEQIYTVDEIGNAGIINSITFKPQGSITRNLQVYMVNTDKTSFTGDTDWVAVTADDLVYSGNVAMAAPQTTITLDDPFTFDGTNLLLVVNDLTGTWTSSVPYLIYDATAQAINIYQDAAAYNPLAPSGTGYVRDFKNQIIINAGAKANRDLLGCNVYVDSVKMNTTPITERQYELTGAQLATLPGGAYNMEGHAVNVTGVFDYGESNYSATVTLYVSGYGSLNGTVKELMSDSGLGGVNVKFSGKDEFNNTVSYEVTTNADGSYAISNVKAGNYDVRATLDGYEPAILEGITVANNVATTVDLLYMHESYNPVYKVYAEEGDVLGTQVADVIWSFSNFTNPNPGGGSGGGGGTGTGATFTEGFESGLPTGWTIVDGNNDGYTWCLTSDIPSTWTYYASMTLDWYRSGTNAICSGSYINGVGALTPNEYLITPQLTLANGSTFSFWAAATDASYAADHFGVFVSDDATDWTMVNEWTLTAKSGGNDGGRASRDGNGAKLGTWYNYTVDLSAYAGEKYIAIRHFNCNDMYIMCVDDIELSNGSKANNLADECGYHNYSNTSRDMWDLLGEVDCTSGYQYGVATDGDFIYTSSWSASSTSQFYKYDMDGNFIEEFNVSGSGQIRDLTYDGEYFYGVANSSTVYCLDLANHALVSSFTSAYGAMRCCGYDSERDGFWVVGNWSGNLTLIDRTGAIQFEGPAPSSASGVAYFKDGEGVEHVYCFNNSNNGIYDYNIATNTISSAAVFNYNNAPGYNSGSSGGCHIANYGSKLAFYGDLQQSPNYIAIYELGEAPTGGSGTTGGSQLATVDHYFQIWRRPVLIENMPTDPAEIEALAIQIAETDPANGFNDTLYTDMVYADLEAGIYEYGVAAVYPWVDRNDNNVTPITWSNDLDHNMTTTLTINASCALGLDRIAGAVVTLFNEAENITVTAELDSAVWMQEDFRKGHYMMTVDLPGYLAIVDGNPIPADGLAMNLWLDEPVINIEFVEDYAPVSSLVVSQTGFARWTDMLPHERVALRYHVMCDDIFQGETEDNYMILNTENLVDGETYTAAVAVVYETGMSDFVTADFTYMSCDHVASQVENLESSVELADVTLTWADGAGTGGGGGGGGGGGTATTFTEGFESGLPTGWTVVDGNSDGWTWCLTSAIPTTWTYYATITLDWYRTGSNAICSGSYINGVGALTPDEYLVTPQVTLAAGSTFSFWAAACDASYAADHFGVFVSDDATNWTMVNEWTLTAKSGGNDGGRASRDGNGAKLGTWYNYTVDLSSYAGDKYIAIRHFNCNDMYIMCVDDIELSAAKGGNNSFMAAGHGFGLANNSLTDDGNWYYYDNGVNEDAIGTGGGNFWWGIMLPAGSYEGNSLTKVAAYDYMAMTGTASIYQGGTTAPAGSALGTVNVSLTGSEDFVEFTFADAITLDPTQNVWVVFYNGSGATYPAAVCTNTGDANGRWVSLDGSTWEDLAGYGLNYTFMVRAYIESAGGGGGGGTTTTSITPNAYNIFMDGEFIGATTDTTFTYTCEDDLEHEYCVMFVDADYNISCENCVVVKADPLGVGQYNVVSAIYPNPTNGNLYINTNANMKSISIVNVLGQVVYNKAAEGTETIIDMAQFGNGIYMVNIVTENGTSVNRIIVNK